MVWIFIVKVTCLNSLPSSLRSMKDLRSTAKEEDDGGDDDEQVDIVGIT
jgi:hypothetical protein